MSQEISGTDEDAHRDKNNRRQKYIHRERERKSIKKHMKKTNA